MRHAKGGYVYHVLNRAAGRATLFAKATDYEAFVRVLAEALDWVDIRLLAYCVMPNHWQGVAENTKSFGRHRRQQAFRLAAEDVDLQPVVAMQT